MIEMPISGFHPVHMLYAISVGVGYVAGTFTHNALGVGQFSNIHNSKVLLPVSRGWTP